MSRRRLHALVLLSTVLAATVLVAAPASAGGGCHSPATEGRGTTIALTDLCFSPTVLRVAPGSEVTFVNRDTMEHPGRPGGAPASAWIGPAPTRSSATSTRAWSEWWSWATAAAPAGR